MCFPHLCEFQHKGMNSRRIMNIDIDKHKKNHEVIKVTTIQKQPPRRFSKISVLFFQEQPFYNFPGESICSSNRHEFSRRVYMFFEQTRIFQEGLSKRHVFLRRFYLFVEQTLLSHRTDTNFSRNPYLVLEHIQIFQEPLFSHRTDTHFPGSSI